MKNIGKNIFEGRSITAFLKRPIFIIGRFRAGTSLLWSFFNLIPRYIAYYEPLHESLLTLAQNESLDPHLRHFNMGKKFTIYRKFINKLSHLYSPEFAFNKLVLSEKDKCINLEKYIKFLINRSRVRLKIPVIKFNRADFRIAWLKKVFNPYIIYIKRNPRDNFYSTITAHPNPPATKDQIEEILSPFVENSMNNHLYYLKHWILLLSDDFPFLKRKDAISCYEKYYFIWRKSVELGEKYADMVIDYDKDFSEDYMRGLLKLCSNKFFNCEEIMKLRDILVPAKIGKWRNLGKSDIWFKRQEDKVDSFIK